MSSDACNAFLDDLAAVVAGDQAALERHLDHLADCDACRDARHEATQAAAAIADAGADYVVPDDLEARILGAVDQTAGDSADDQPAPAADSTPTGDAEPAEPDARPDQRADADAVTPLHSSGRSGRGRWFVVAAAAAAIALAGGLLATRHGGSKRGQVAESTAAAAATTARVTRIQRSANDARSGVEVTPPGGVAAPVEPGDLLAAGSVIRTDERTRLSLELDDGSTVILNHLTELALSADAPRRLHLTRGELVADVAHDPDHPARIATPSGEVEVLGTAFDLSAADDFTSVRVTRGLVRLSGEGDRAVQVRPGEEGSINAGAAPTVAPAVDLAGAVAWSELGGEPAEATPAGIGELRAFKPGEKRDKDWRLSVARASVKVRIVGNVARTEIEETFRNDSDVALEGVYKFPMPADASIDRLALDVAGGFEEGAFVDKERAAKIWRGVIDKATPEHERRPTQEIIWVPGPWRDPALLEWQRGGRFELKIFPIPARGERTIKLGYTQTIRPHGARRRYVYPLAHSQDESNTVGQFDVDVRVSGADPKRTIRTIGYRLDQAADGDATRLALSQQRFVPNGDLIVEYSLPDSKAELRAWTFQGAAAVAPVTAGGKGKNKPAPEVVAAQRAIAADARPFALLALRPTLPRWTEAHPRDYLIVIDSSQSMVGERFTRASRLAAALVGQMDRQDRFAVMACDLGCQALSDQMERPSSARAAEVARWLGEIAPAGSSDLIATLSAAAAAPALAGRGDREGWVLYLSDGMASVGHRRPAAIAGEAATLAESTKIHFTTIGIGGDADTATLAAIARAGGGQYVPWVPGATVAGAALGVLETTYGVQLRDPVVELPPGLTEVAPAALPTLRAGNELLIAARFQGKVSGQVVLKGTVGGKPYINRFPISLEPSTAKGNGFVPRMWASLRIGALELSGRGEDKSRIVALSKAFGVMSRHTSLLVLESEAMFNAFAIDRGQPAVRWSGEEETQVVESKGLYAYDDATSDRKAKRASGKMMGHTRAKPRASRPAKRPAMDEATMGLGGPGGLMDPEPPAPRGRRGWRRMRRVWFRVGEISGYDGVSPNITRAVADFEAALQATPDSRERHRDLVQALSYAGNLDRAYQIASEWLTRDRLDPEALVYMADILGRQGQRDQALRLLSGIVDIEPDTIALHRRLARAYDRIGAAERACAHRVTLAEIESGDAKTVAAAVRCERALGDQRGAGYLLRSAKDDAERAAIEAAATKPARDRRVAGQLVLDATWSGATDIDLTVVTPQGTRLSWMGGRDVVVADSASDLRRERLGLRKIARGKYLIEVSRTHPGDTTPVTGSIEVRLLGKRQSIPFQLADGARRTVGRLTVSSRSRLEPF